MILELVKKSKLVPIKLISLSVLQTILLILIAVFAILTKNTFDEFGWGINTINSNLSLGAQNIRIFLMLYISLYCLSTTFIFYYNIKYPYHHHWIWIFSLFNFVILPYLVYKEINEKSTKQYFSNYWRYNNNSQGIIDLKFKNNKSININTIIWIITTLLFIIGVVMFFINDVNDDKADPMNLFIIGKLSYFTHLTNLFCCIYLIALACFKKRKIFTNNCLLICMNSYIIVVGLVFWCILFPSGVLGEGVSVFQMTRWIWLHAITPISFIVFTVMSLKTSVLKKMSYWSIIGKGLIYPLWYGSYIFTLPFLTRVTIYGEFTNLNPQMILYDGTSGGGSPLYLIIIPSFGLLFVIFFSIFYFADKKVNLVEQNFNY